MSTLLTSLETAATGTAVATADLLDALAWNADGLVPAIAQAHDTGEVLMLAWMNRASLEETLASGRVCYWSRSRQRFWRKGEESGHRQFLVAASTDCDGDTLLLQVRQEGPACHTARRSCFYVALDETTATVTAAPAA